MTDRRVWALASLAAAVIVAVARRWTSWGRDEYAIWPDEPAQLAIARFIGGGTRWNMDDHSVWRPLFGTLLAPVYWFTDNPTTVFHAALTLNALLGGIAAALLVYLARRLTPMTPWWSAAIAVLVCLAPAMVFSTDFVFSESLVAPLFLATLLSLLRLQQSPTLANGLLTALLASAAFGAHSRMLPLTLITVGVIGLAVIRRRMAVRDGSVGIAAAAAGIYVVTVYTAYVVDRLWDEPSTRNSIGGVREQLLSGVPVLVSALGQTWYLLVASLGVVVYGSIILVRAAVRPDPRSESRVGPTCVDARLVLLVVGACVALSMVFMSNRWRSDQLVYGRYNDVVIQPILMVGLAALIGAIALRRLAVIAAATAVAIVAAGGALWALRSDVLSTSNGIEPMILGLQPFATSATSIDVMRISVWAAALTLGLAGLTLAVRGRRRSLAVAGAVGMLVVLGWVRTERIVERTWDDSGDASAVEELRDGV
ncbi:MAG TPA: hypothetical protein VES40_16115, partial [Ilumatobacteraceae bacterium]|nr:hypothetical protein [Ilumatobacteraceae bacterium]